MAAPNPPARLNRSLTAVVGLLLLAAAALGAAANLGRLPGLDSAAPTLTVPATVPDWWTWFAAVVGVVIALAALRWLLAQTRRRPGAATWDLPSDAGSEPGGVAGRTRMVSSAATEPLIDDLTAHPTIRDASARLTGDVARPRLDLEITVDEHADLSAVRAHLDRYALPRLRTALDAPALATHLLLRAGTTTAQRVR